MTEQLTHTRATLPHRLFFEPPCAAWRILVPQSEIQILNSGPEQQKCRVLATGLPGNSWGQQAYLSTPDQYKHTHTHTHTTMHCILELAFSVFLLHRGKGSTCLAMVNTFLEPHQHNYKDFFPAIFSFSVISSLSSLSFSLLHHSQKHKKKIFSSPILKYKQVKNNKMKEKLSVEPMFPSAFTPFSWVPFTTT